MVYRFIILSDEVEDFRRDIKISSDATFRQLNDTILASVDYKKDEMTSFFTCDEDWEKETEITLVDMGSSSEEDNYLMDETLLEELLEDEKQKLLFVFDYLTERSFFMELREIIPGEDLDQPLVTRSEGLAPSQTTSFDDLDLNIPLATTAAVGLDDDDLFADDFNIDDYDDEALGDLQEGNPFEY